MSKKNLFYIHGYQSEPHSTKGTLLYRTLGCTAISYRSGKPEDLIIADALRRISRTISDKQNIVLIGSSLGGFLAAATALHHSNIIHLILLNPAILPLDFDITSITSMPHRILHDMKQPQLFSTNLPMPITILRGTNDTVVPDNWILTFAKAQQATIHFLHDDHSLTDSLEKLPTIIQEIIKS